MTGREDVERRAAMVAAGSFVASILAGIALFFLYVAGGETRLEGLLLFVGFGGLALGLILWAKVLIAEPDAEEERPVLMSPAEEREGFLETYAEASARIGRDPSRRRFLTRLLAAAGGSLGVALLLPFRSLGEPPGVSLFRTEWEEGRRVVGFDGEPIRPGDLAIGGVVTVFPEDAVGAGDSQALLVRLPEDDFDLPPGAPQPVDGVVGGF
jgi:ubiquinol-cytochrome c reductase iron-sulfur subunit